MSNGRIRTNLTKKEHNNVYYFHGSYYPRIYANKRRGDIDNEPSDDIHLRSVSHRDLLSLALDSGND